MIFGNLHYKSQCDDLDEKLQVCLRYAHDHVLAEYAPGRYEIDDDALYVNISCVQTASPETKMWEAHRAYLDLHLVLSGQERIDLNFIDNMECKPYVAQDDFLPVAGNRKASVVLDAGDFLVCYPEDAHMPGLHETVPGELKKAVFKIKI